MNCIGLEKRVRATGLPVLWMLVVMTVVGGAATLTACNDGDDDSTKQRPDNSAFIPKEQQPDDTLGIPNEALTLESVLREEKYSPDEFLRHLGSPSMGAMLDTTEPLSSLGINNLAHALASVKLGAHLPHLDSLFAAEVGTEADGSRRWRFESYTFTYKSVTSYGQSVVMSGRVTFPNNVVDGTGHEVSTLTLHSHQDLLFSDCAPSENLMFMPMRAMYNSAVIEPDFQHCGINNTKIADGTGSPKALTRQLVDCAIAALEVMHQHGVKLAPNGHTTNWGTSKNFAVPIGFAKYYETEAPQWLRDAIRLGATFAGEGAFDLGETMPYFFKHPEYYSVGLYFMCYVYGLTASQLGGYGPTDIMSPWLASNIHHIGDKDYTLSDAISLGLIRVFTLEPDPRLPEITSTDQILAPDVLTADGLMDESNPKVQAILRGLSEEGDVYDWVPTLPIYFAHCPFDRVLPYSDARQAYLRFSNQETNPAIHWIDVPYPEALVESADQLHVVALHAFVSFFMHLYMSCVEEPADMAKIYRQ